jgi:hypothetical protein
MINRLQLSILNLKVTWKYLEERMQVILYPTISMYIHNVGTFLSRIISHNQYSENEEIERPHESSMKRWIIVGSYSITYRRTQSLIVGLKNNQWIAYSPENTFKN